MAISQSVFLVLDIVPCKDDEDTGPETSFRVLSMSGNRNVPCVCVRSRYWKASTQKLESKYNLGRELTSR